MRSHIDNASKINHLLPPNDVRRLKYMQNNEDRNIEVQRENRRLLENITRIICSGRKNHGSRSNMKSRAGSAVSGASARSRSASQTSLHGPGGPHKSLNAEYNKRVQHKIRLENTVSLIISYMIFFTNSYAFIEFCKDCLNKKE